MVGAIIGDIVGSRFEWKNHKDKDFELFTKECKPTDDSIMSLAVAGAIAKSAPDFMDLSEQAVKWMQGLGRKYPKAGYGPRFRRWLKSEEPAPYNSYGNGSAMRVSAAGFAASSLEEALMLAQKVTEVTHDHLEGMKGAEATVTCIYMARTGSSIGEIKDYINEHYYPMDFTLDEIRPKYKFHATCQKSVPQALMAFFESTSFEDAIRNAISIGGDSDTIAAICGGIAEAYYDVPKEIRDIALTFLDDDLQDVLEFFEKTCPH